KVGGKSIEVPEPTEPDVHVGDTLSVYTVDFSEGFGNNVYVSSTLALERDYIQQIITIENTDEREEKPVEIELLPRGNGVYYLFNPMAKTTRARYYAISPSGYKERGYNLIVTFDTFVPSYPQIREINLKSNFIRVFSWNVKLAPKKKEVIVLKYNVGYITDETLLENATYSIPLSKQYLLNAEIRPLVNVVNADALSKIAPNVAGIVSSQDAINGIITVLDGIPDIEIAGSELKTEIDGKAVIGRRDIGLTSIEKAVIYRELCRGFGVPTELRIGEHNGKYYAWAVSYVGVNVITYDPAGKKSKFRQLYSEPVPLICKSKSLYECPWSGGIRPDVLCIGTFCMSAYILIGAVVLIVILLFVIFQYKTEYLYPLLGVKRGKPIVKEEKLKGTYKILKKFSPNTPLEESVWNELKRRHGIFSPDEFERVTGFSKILVNSVIEDLIQKGVIKKEL
ncbi:MAG: hypothetical protein J7K68_05805, partial [Candidatus Diapherotrites archaeon]|nr:hypothetical protein [Candidatus Diapherotrites archaeon]